ncbi:NAD(P)H-dependent flavin oxidoreductase [Leucobacter sp. HY1908]
MTTPATNTAWAKALGLTAPIVCAPMGGAAGGRLAAAVSRAGGLGMIGMGSAGSAVALERELAAFEQALAADSALAADQAPVAPPLGIGMVDWGIVKHPDMLERAIAAKPALISVSFGDWRPGGQTPKWITQVQAAGLRTIAQVATVAEAQAAAGAGIDAVVARGLEGGGHGDHAEPLARLLDDVLAAVKVPVLAAGAITTTTDVQRVLNAGAAAAWVGTAFAACEESLTPPAARAAMIAARGSGTMVTRVYDVALDRPWPAKFPERLIPTSFITEWQGREAELARDEVAKREFAAACAAGDFTVVPVDAGQGVDAVTRVRPAAEVLRELAGW